MASFLIPQSIILQRKWRFAQSDQCPNKTLQRTPSRDALLSHDRLSFLYTSQPELDRLIGVTELDVRLLKYP